MKSIILLYGALGSKEQMFPLVIILSETYDVHTFDFSGHGEMANVDQAFSIEHMSYELNEYIKESKIKNPIVFGYSMGGYVALYHALLYPGIINCVITLATKFDWSPEIAVVETKQLDVAMMKEKIPDFIKVLNIRHGGNWEKVVRNTASMMLDLGKKRLLNSQNLPNISICTMFCIGDKDKMVSLNETKSTASLLQKGSLKILSDTPHPFERVNYDKLAQAIIEYCQHIETRGT